MNIEVQVNLDLLWGVREIGGFLGIDPNKAFRLLKSGELPGRMMGGKWCARKSELLDAFTFASPRLSR